MPKSPYILEDMVRFAAETVAPRHGVVMTEELVMWALDLAAKKLEAQAQVSDKGQK